MSLLSRLNDDMQTAMKEKDKESLQVIRMIKSSIQKEQIKEGHDLTEEEELTVLSREMKQRRDSLHEFEEAGRDDLAEKVKSEIVIVEKYMPEQLSDEEIRQLVQEAITQRTITILILSFKLRTIIVRSFFVLVKKKSKK